MSILIPEEYEKIGHHILEEVCPVCNKQFKVGDSIEMVPIQKSIDGNPFNSETVILHTECHFV